MSGRVRRTRFAYLTAAEARLPDVAELLRGRVQLVATQQLLADSLLTAARSVVTLDELAQLLELSDEAWTPATEATLSLARRGIVVSDLDEEPFASLRLRNERLERAQWHGEAALYHLGGNWRGVRVAVDEPTAPLDEQELEDALRIVGEPPSHFHRRGGARETLRLPPAAGSGGIYDALRARKTTRAFDREAPLQLGQLSHLLGWTFGAQGIETVIGGLTILKKTSPSGGALHPVEAYPLVLRVEGVEPGIYHYAVAAHALELLHPLAAEDAERHADEFTAGQTYFADAAVLVILTARFERSFWKYRRHPRAYSVTVMDAGHLAQTFALVAADLRVGAFVTAAINGGDIDDALGLDGVSEGTLAVLGCGVPALGPSDLEPRFRPFSPDS